MIIKPLISTSEDGLWFFKDMAVAMVSYGMRDTKKEFEILWSIAYYRYKFIRGA